MTDMRIIYECAKGYKLRTRVQLYSNPIFDELQFVDLESGRDGCNGEDWDNAKKTIGSALDAFTGGGLTGRRKAILVRGAPGGTAQTAGTTIDVDGVSILGGAAIYGFGGGYDAELVGPATGVSLGWVNPDSVYTANALTAALYVSAKDVEIAGIHFVRSTQAKDLAWIGLGNLTSAAGAGDGSAIHDNLFEGRIYGDGSYYECGVHASGAQHVYIGYNTFAFLGVGIHLMAGGQTYCHNVLMEHNKIVGSKRGIIFGAEGVAGCHSVQDEVLLSRFGYATLSAGFWMRSTAEACSVRDAYVMNATNTTAYKDDSSGYNNVFINCKYGLTNGAGTVFPA